jgi:hypothetical protein
VFEFIKKKIHNFKVFYFCNKIIALGDLYPFYYSIPHKTVSFLVQVREKSTNILLLSYTYFYRRIMKSFLKAFSRQT